METADTSAYADRTTAVFKDVPRRAAVLSALLAGEEDLA